MALDDEARRKILQQIEASGFPLELRVADDLHASGWNVHTNVRFSDLVGTGETDIIATRTVEGQAEVGVSLVIECKRSRSKPWVFFRHGWQSAEKHAAAMLFHDLQFEDPSILTPGAAQADFRKMHYNAPLPYSKTHFEAHKSDAGQEIYKATHGTLRSSDSFQVWLRNQLRSNGRMVRLILPVVVFEGDMVVATRHGNTFTLEEAEHVLYRTTRLLGDAWSPAGHVSEALVDVVRVDSFGKFMAIATEDMKFLNSHITSVWDQRRVPSR